MTDEPNRWRYVAEERRMLLEEADALHTTLRLALSPEGGHNGWRPAHGDDSLVDLALNVRERMEIAHQEHDKTLKALEQTEAWYATRIRRLEDLCKQYGCWDQAASILANGTASPTEPRTYEQLLNVAQSRAEKAEANLARMVERAANQRLDGYRELGARAAAAENESDRLRERLRNVTQILIAEVGADGPMDAEDAASKAVARMDNLRRLADQSAHEAGLYARRMEQAQARARKSAPQDEESKADACYVIHSPYPDGSWRGWEKCIGDGSRAIRLFTDVADAESHLRGMGETAQYFHIVRVQVGTPTVGDQHRGEP